MERKRGRPAGARAAGSGTGSAHTWPREGLPEGTAGYLETTSILDGAPVRIAVPDDPDGEAAALAEALNDPEVVAHVGSREALAAEGPPVSEAQVYAELGLEPPEKRYSGTFRVRVPKDLHRTLAAQAERQGVSLNTLIVSYLADRAARTEAVAGRTLVGAPARPSATP
jgi:hypothetical protein